MNNIPTPPLLQTYPLIEEILDNHQDHARGDERGWSSYRGHVYRVFNMARALVPDQDHRDDKLAIAAAFHDIDVFTSLDYLGPSIGTMDAWLRRTGRGTWGEELAIIIAKHHHLTTYRGRHARLAEPFRRADLNDLSQGLIRIGMPRGHVRAVRASIDVGCFSPGRCRGRLCGTWSATHSTRYPSRALGEPSSRPATPMRIASALGQAGETPRP